MKVSAFALAVLMALASCGADGRPTAPVAKSGVSISGELRAGIQS